MAANNTTTVDTVEILGLTLCYLVDFPSSLIDCSKERCVRCNSRGTYFSGASIDDHGSFSHFLNYFILSLTTLVSISGMVGNAVIIKVLISRKCCYRSFDSLLLMLAGWDIFGCFMKTVASTAITSYFGNWFGRGKGTMYFYLLSFYISMFARSGSTFMTLLITVERYLMIAFPIKTHIWFTSKNTNFLVSTVVVISIALNYPRYVSLCIVPNDLKDIPSLQSLDYILRSTEQGKFWYRTMRAVHNQIDFWLPYPVILVFNLLSYWKVKQLSKRRKELNVSQNQNIRAAKMFLRVVAIYFVTNLLVSVSYFSIHFLRTTYRELILLGFLATATNSAVNLPIYCYYNTAFKAEARVAMQQFKEAIWRHNN